MATDADADVAVTVLAEAVVMEAADVEAAITSQDALGVAAQP